MKSASVRVVCLPPFHTQLPAGFQCSIAGYGFESYSTYCRIASPQIHNWSLSHSSDSNNWLCFLAVGQYSQYLKKTEAKLISRAHCKSESYYGDLITKNMFCAGSPDWSTDSCKVSQEHSVWICVCVCAHGKSVKTEREKKLKASSWCTVSASSLALHVCTKTEENRNDWELNLTYRTSSKLHKRDLMSSPSTSWGVKCCIILC